MEKQILNENYFTKNKSDYKADKNIFEKTPWLCDWDIFFVFWTLMILYIFTLLLFIYSTRAVYLFIYVPFHANTDTRKKLHPQKQLFTDKTPNLQKRKIMKNWFYFNCVHCWFVNPKHLHLVFNTFFFKLNFMPKFYFYWQPSLSTLCSHHLHSTFIFKMMDKSVKSRCWKIVIFIKMLVTSKIENTADFIL